MLEEDIVFEDELEFEEESWASEETPAELKRKEARRDRFMRSLAAHIGKIITLPAGFQSTLYALVHVQKNTAVTVHVYKYGEKW